MTTPKDTIWPIEPHTLAKHEILRRYLAAWYPILCRYNSCVVYIDGFCGPGRYLGGEPGSPIIAIKEAIKHGDLLDKNKLTFLFVDERSDRIEHLKSEIAQIDLPKNFSVNSVAGEFEEKLRSLLIGLNEMGSQLAPTFAFIDPFGFKGLPFELICELIINPKTEVFISFMADSINRFLEHPDPKIRNDIVDVVGTTEALKIAQMDEQRIEALRFLYQKQLQKNAKFVRYFEMRNEHNRLIYYLFFATNHPLGHLKMKEAFWKVDDSSGFRFSDATNPNQLVLFNITEIPTLLKELQKEFSGEKLSVNKISEFVENETSFLPKHMRSVLKDLESQQKINVDEIKLDGRRRRSGTFPENTVVHFLN